VGPDQGLELTATPFFAQEKYQCGPAALAMVLGASGVAVHPDDLAPAVYLPGRQGSLQMDLSGACRQWGRIAYPIPSDLTGLTAEIQSGRPVLVLQNLGFERWPVYHYAVVIGVLPPDRLILRSGVKERVEMTVADFNRTWRRAGSWGLIALCPGDLPKTADPLTYITVVAGFESAGNAVSATAAYQAALAAWPDNSTVLFALANNHLEQNRPARAEALYRTLLAADPDHVAGANNLAEALARQGDFAQALTVIQTAVNTAEKTSSPLLEVIEQTRREIEQAMEENIADPF
jgi:hypothetical protein